MSRVRVADGSPLWPVGQAVKTPPFHGGIGGSIPPRVTIWTISSAGRAPALQAGCRQFDPVIVHHISLHESLQEARFFIPRFNNYRFILIQPRLCAEAFLLIIGSLSIDSTDRCVYTYPY